MAYIIDDDEGFRESFRVLLDSYGMQTRVFGSGNEFLSAFETLEPGWIILDVDMPGLSGIEVLKQLENLGNTMPVIMVTGSPIGPIARALGDSSVFRLLDKAFATSRIIETIEQYRLH